jgi:hypothetical protein
VFIPAAAAAFGEAGLISLEPIYGYLKKMGYSPLKEGVLIEDWLVQFIPTFEPMQEEAIAKSRRVTFGKTETNIFAAEYLAAELLRSGRGKDLVRVLALLEGNHVNMKEFREIIHRHGLTEKWKKFTKQFDLED